MAASLLISIRGSEELYIERQAPFDGT